MAPSEGFGFRAPPVADTARKASRCRPQVRERIAEARAENGEGAKLADCIRDLGSTTEGEITRGCCLHKGVGVHKVIQVSLLFSARLYSLLSQILGVSLLPSRRFNPLYAVPPPSSEGGEGAPAPRTEINGFFGFRYSCVRGRQRLAASLYPPPAALESQTPQREPRALPRRGQN